jgi:hypothetical protein
MARTAEVITVAMLDEIHAELDQTELKFQKLEKSRVRLVQAQETEAAEMLAEAVAILFENRTKLIRKLFVKSLGVFEDHSSAYINVETVYNVAREMVRADEQLVKDAEAKMVESTTNPEISKIEAK